MEIILYLSDKERSEINNFNNLKYDILFLNNIIKRNLIERIYINMYNFTIAAFIYFNYRKRENMK